METSLIIAKILGPYYLIVGVGILRNQSTFRALVRESAESPLLTYVTGLIALIVSLIIVVVHNVWSGWAVAITILGWLGVLKGTVRVIAPDVSKALMTRFAANKNAFTAAALLALVLGAYFTALGYWLGPLG